MTTTALAPVDNAAAAVVLFDQDKFDAFYAKLEAEIKAVPVDLTTDKGRKAIASVAAKVRSEKAGIDRDRKRLTQEWRDNTALVNNAWKGIEAKLDTLAVAARKPLTDWEEAEKEREQKARAIIDLMERNGALFPADTAETIRERGATTWKIEITEERYGSLMAEAQATKDRTIAFLKSALERALREEADKAGLERLRAAEAERLAKEQAEREEREAAERAEADAKAEEERRAAAEQAEQERIAAVQREAEDRAKAEAEAAAQAERDRIQREHDEALASERRRAEEAEAARQKAEHQREWSQKIIQHCRDCGNGIIGGQSQPFGILIRELEEKVTATTEEFGDFAANVEQARRDALDRVLQVQREAAERSDREAREADKVHRSSVKTAAKQALMTCGADEETARKIVVAILANEIPNVRLEF